jgi:hypothetical protein
VRLGRRRLVLPPEPRHRSDPRQLLDANLPFQVDQQQGATVPERGVVRRHQGAQPLVGVRRRHRGPRDLRDELGEDLGGGHDAALDQHLRRRRERALDDRADRAGDRRSRRDAISLLLVGGDRFEQGRGRLHPA